MYFVTSNSEVRMRLSYKYVNLHKNRTILSFLIISSVFCVFGVNTIIKNLSRMDGSVMK